MKLYPMTGLFEVLKPGGKDWALAESIDPERLPAHVAVIMDGNGRWAGKRGLPRVAGHRAGLEPVRVTVETCARLELKLAADRLASIGVRAVVAWNRPDTSAFADWKDAKVSDSSRLSVLRLTPELRG